MGAPLIGSIANQLPYPWNVVYGLIVAVIFIAGAIALSRNSSVSDTSHEYRHRKKLAQWKAKRLNAKIEQRRNKVQ